jgi:hypothetical protein
MRRLASLATLGLVLTACASSPPPVQTAATSRDPEIRAIYNVLVAFQHALVTRDGDALAKLMAGPDIVLRSRAVDSGQVFSSTAEVFTKSVTESKESWEEQFANVVITARDGIATLDSDYKFLAGGKQTNHGREVWTLIRAGTDWKISMITWSIIADH